MRKPENKKIRLYKRRADLDGLRASVATAGNSFLTTGFEDIESMWAAFKTVISEAVDQHVPTKFTSTRRTHPWVNTSLRRMMRRKQRAHRKAKTSGNQRDWERFKRLQAELQRSTRKAHRSYMQDVVSADLKENPKRFWSFIKSKRQEGTGVSELVNKDGFLQSNTTAKAEILNEQFHSVYTQEDTGTIPNKGPSPHPSMHDITVNLNGVKKLLKNLKPYKASGPDGIPTYILRAAAEELAPMMTRLFQSSLDTGLVPTEWRRANIVPLFKKGLKHLTSNYRPVSLTSVACKVLEHIIHSNVMRHFDENNILTVKQHGFRKKRSCVTQLVTTIQGIASQLRTGRDQVDVILLDFAKAFDKVPHQRLLYKLNYYGVRGHTLQWIESFLGHRTQQVLLDGSCSSQADVISGVPQGTVMGPLLFLAFINDLPQAVKHSDPHLFADDCLLYRLVRTDDDARKLQEDLDALEEWEATWQMKFHPEKCQVIRINLNKRFERQSIYRLHRHILEVVDSGKYLGVHLTNDLTWHKHIDSTVAKKGTSRQRSGKGAIRKRFPLQKPRWEKTKLTIRYLYHETYRKPNEQLFSQ